MTINQELHLEQKLFEIIVYRARIMKKIVSSIIEDRFLIILKEKQHDYMHVKIYTIVK